MMQAQRISPTSRRLELTGLPDTVAGISGMPTEMTIDIRYVGDSNGTLAISLDNVVIPAIIDALNHPAGQAKGGAA